MFGGSGNLCGYVTDEILALMKRPEKVE